MEEFENFCEELHVKSKAIHAKSDRLVQLKLAVALTDSHLYRQVLCDFFCVYKAIEEGVARNIEHEYIKDLWISNLERSSLFEEDLKYYGRLGKKSLVTPSDSALEYAAHIADIAENEPELLLAYIHTMYLAIFSGGFIIRGIIKKTLGIPGPDGVRIFDIPEGMTRGEIKSHIKETINRMQISRPIKNRIIQERIDIFKRNNSIAAAIEPNASSYKRLALFIFGVLSIIFLCIFLAVYYIGN